MAKDTDFKFGTHMLQGILLTGP